MKTTKTQEIMLLAAGMVAAVSIAIAVKHVATNQPPATQEVINPWGRTSSEIGEVLEGKPIGTVIVSEHKPNKPWVKFSNGDWYRNKAYCSDSMFLASIIARDRAEHAGDPVYTVVYEPQNRQTHF